MMITPRSTRITPKSGQDPAHSPRFHASILHSALAAPHPKKMVVKRMMRRVMNDSFDLLLLVFMSVSPVSTVQRVRRQCCLEDNLGRRMKIAFSLSK